MRTISAHLAALGAAFLFLAPAHVTAQEMIVVADFSNAHLPPATLALTATGKLRRGTVSDVQIIKNLIDLVPDAQINVSGATFVGGVSHGHSSSGTGMIDMKVSVPATATVGSTVTINVGFLDHFHFTVLHQGQISNVSFTPNPTTTTGGTPITVTVSGTDLGSGPVIPSVSCHNIAAGARSNTAFAVTLTRPSTCTQPGPFTVSVKSTATGDPVFYTTSTGQLAFPFGPYTTAPGVACVSAPGILAPAITTPANGQTIQFAQGASTTQAIHIAWVQGQVPAPNNEWIVDLATHTTVGRQIPTTSATVTGLGTVRNLAVPGSYTVTVRPRNCGTQPQPTATSNFHLSF